MVAFPLSVLALAAGVYLLIKVKREYMGALMSGLAWLVIVLALAGMVLMGVRSFKNCNQCKRNTCQTDQQVCNKQGGTCDGSEKGKCDGPGKGMGCTMGNDSMPGCHMQGDSMVMDQSTCEMMIGKEACATMMKERGSCIMSQEEYMKMGHCGKGNKSNDCPKGKAKCCKK